MPQSYINRLVLEHKRYYRGKPGLLEHDMKELSNVFGASLDTSELFSGANPKLEQRILFSRVQLGIEYHIMAYVLSDLEGNRNVEHLNNARGLLRKMQAVQAQLPSKK